MKRNSLPLRNLLLVKAALALVLAAPMAKTANADVYDYNDFDTGYGDFGSQTDQVSQRIDSYLYQGDSLDILQELNLSRNLRQGDKILSVKIKAEALENRSGLKLMKNGQLIEKVRLNQQLQTVTIDLAQGFSEQIHSLELKGKAAYIKKITVELEKAHTLPLPPIGGGGNGQGVLKAHLNEYVMGGDVLKVKKLIREHTGVRLAGQQVKRVVLKGLIYSRNITAQLVMNGYPVGAPVTASRYDNRLVLKVPARQAQRGNLQVEILNGSMEVELLKVKLAGANNGGGDYPGYGNSVTVQVNQGYRGHQQLNLSNLIRRSGNRVDTYKQVESVTITARGRGSVSLQERRTSHGSMHLNSSMMRTETIYLGYGSASLAELNLALSGRTYIQSIKVKYKRY